MSGTHELAKINEVVIGKEDHGIHTVWLRMVGEPGEGWGQGFGGLSFGSDSPKNPFDKRLRDHFLKGLFRTFDVKDAERLKGQHAYVLRNWDRMNEPIVGLESVVTGRIFTIADWRKDAYKVGLLEKKFVGKNELEERIDSIKRDIGHWERRVVELRQELATIGDGYHEWRAR